MVIIVFKLNLTNLKVCCDTLLRLYPLSFVIEMFVMLVVCDRDKQQQVHLLVVMN